MILFLALAIASGLLGLSGILLTVADTRGARRRTSAYQKRGYTHYLSAQGRARVSGSASISGPPPSLEQRIASLETTVEQLQEVIVKTEDDLRAEFNASLRQVMAEYDATIQERFQALRGLVIGRRQTWLRAYLGPLLVALGIVLGTIAAFIPH